LAAENSGGRLKEIKMPSIRAVKAIVLAGVVVGVTLVAAAPASTDNFSIPVTLSLQAIASKATNGILRLSGISDVMVNTIAAAARESYSPGNYALGVGSTMSGRLPSASVVPVASETTEAVA
jgi:hypothetical protein